ncbi:hypothetical protein Moror_1997 [Moniliophthora roreri MCA 2997]|uniref:Uncharacterized protein n=2 Tax=Moniliophthora roreri TaxID=221103 RepID=V2WL14_MONRO|nr:hypothetical protein Moror_1997 [Moniliophthora roreri MCA 2997]KAI3615072.1 hypothetical protein WG66_016893 [Moniliophthora roreri]
MTVAVDTRTVWPTQPTYSFPGPPSYYDVMPAHNTKELNRDMLINVLEYLSTLLATEFRGTPVRLVAHGGACMLLHPGLYNLAKRKELYHQQKGENSPMRYTTRDVDYIRRSFIQEYSTKHQMPDAAQRLQKCIRATAIQFGLGADWMNADADVALPMTTNPVTLTQFDPIYEASLKPNNVELYTVFVSKNKMLSIINVTPAWAVALKLVRYAKWDPTDISLLLMNGTDLSNTHWTVDVVKRWLTQDCAAMNYQYYDAARTMQMHARIEHAVKLVAAIGKHLPTLPGSSHSTPSYSPVTRITSPGLANKHRPSQSFSSLRLADVPVTTQRTSVSNPLVPTGSLDSTTWQRNPNAQFNATTKVAGPDADSYSLHRRKEQKKHSKRGVPTPNAEWHLRALQATPLLPESLVKRSRSVEFGIPAPVGGHSVEPPYRQWNERDGIPTGKRASRRKEKQNRDIARDRERQSKWEARDGNSFGHFDESDFDETDFDGTDSDSDESDSEDDSDSDSRSSLDMPLVSVPAGKLEYVPMPEPPPEAWTHDQHAINDNKNSTTSYSRRPPHPPSHSHTWPQPSASRSLRPNVYSQSHNHSTPQMSPPPPPATYQVLLQAPAQNLHPYSAQTHADALRHRTSTNTLGLAI